VVKWAVFRKNEIPLESFWDYSIFSPFATIPFPPLFFQTLPLLTGVDKGESPVSGQLSPELPHPFDRKRLSQGNPIPLRAGCSIPNIPLPSPYPIRPDLNLVARRRDNKIHPTPIGTL
jgi:hypothetical protein